jgi:hypothetical protein
MGLFPEKFGLADSATTKEINAMKKRINWGEIPAFFQLVSSSIAEAEGFIQYGFDNAYKRIVDRRNWNFDKLGLPPGIKLSEVMNFNEIEPLTRPRICLYHVFSPQGYELLAFPYVNGTMIDQFRRDDRNMEFSLWDPTQMKVLVRINQFHKFIAMTLSKGDDADIALVLHANNVVNKMIQMLSKEVKLTEVKGMTIVQAYKLQNANPGKSPDDVIITSQLDDEFKPAQ